MNAWHTLNIRKLIIHYFTNFLIFIMVIIQQCLPLVFYYHLLFTLPNCLNLVQVHPFHFILHILGWYLSFGLIIYLKVTVMHEDLQKTKLPVFLFHGKKLKSKKFRKLTSTAGWEGYGIVACEHFLSSSIFLTLDPPPCLYQMTCFLKFQMTCFLKFPFKWYSTKWKLVFMFIHVPCLTRM